jgi:hypothetical protein
MNHDMVFWSMIVCIAIAALVPTWLLLNAYLKATKDKDKK